MRFSLVKAAGHSLRTNVPADPKSSIHSGALSISTGICGNDKVAGFLIRSLAVQHVGGVEVTFRMVDPCPVERWRMGFEKVLGLRVVRYFPAKS